jgi:hypothetical protein
MEEKRSESLADVNDSEPKTVKFSLNLLPTASAKPKSILSHDKPPYHVTEFDPSVPPPHTVKSIPKLQNSWCPHLAWDGAKASAAHLNGRTHSTEEGFLSKDESEKEKLREDIQHCADEASLEAYEGIPVEEFGEAMLRGMGWSHGMGIGLRAKGPVAPYECPRRKVARLGLGATLPAL